MNITEEEYNIARKVVAQYEKERNIQLAIKRYGAGYATIKKTDCKVLPDFIHGNRPVKFVFFSTELDGVENRNGCDAYIQEEVIQGQTVFSVSGSRSFKKTEEEAIASIHASVKNKIKSILKNGH